MIPEPATTPDREDVLRRIPSVLRRADLALLAAKERPLRTVGVSGSNYSVLINLRTTPGLTGAELARTIGVTPQAVAPLVGKLVERELIERRVHPRHSTVQELHLTEKGAHELLQADRIMADLDLYLRHRLGEENHQLLHDLLAEVIEHLPAWTPPS